MGCRHRICTFWDRDKGRQGCNISVCKASQFSIFGIRDSRVTAWGRQKAQEFKEDAYGLLCLSWSGSGRYLWGTI